MSEQFRKHLLQDGPVLQNVADARRSPAIVFQDEKLPAPIAHQVGADHVQVLLAGRIETRHLRTITFRLQHELGRNLAFSQDALLVVDVMEE